MSDGIFRKKSIERIQSPEQLNDYIKVANPGVWMILAAIIILLAGAIVWGCLGHLDTTLDTVAVAENGKMTVYVKEEDISSVSEGMTVRIDKTECSITSISAQPLSVDGDFSDYALHLGDIQVGEWVYIVTISGDFEDGVYSAKIVTESVSPISFVLN